ncbi:uncharacterized protein LOC131433177 [Malaya genurostris]|uniref:uncharacterized protein LOC131433177 n=1 Tax=Malaya genurostris TaxID=325434 RepID=UPI0026F3DF07|nr:uncharacterized protein LOC131433177 [Malaya genurostris]
MEPGTEAEWFLRVDRSHSYEEFREHFLGCFGHRLSMSEVIDKLRRTTFSTCKTTVVGYILRMQEIASCADIDEALTVQMIVDGFQDRTADISVLYPATNLMQLMHLARRYAQLRELRPSSARITSTCSSKKPKPKDDSELGLRCYNCSGEGHISARCPEHRRERGSCFRCGSQQHVIRNCPRPAPQNKNKVALVDDFRQNCQPDAIGEQLGGEIAEINRSDQSG